MCAAPTVHRLTLTRRIPAEQCSEAAAVDLPMTAQQRRRARQRLRLDQLELGIALPPGTQLHPGDQLADADDTRYVVRAAAERVLRVDAQRPVDLTRAAYHLGNRHVLVEIGVDYLAIEDDPVLAELLVGLGLQVQEMLAPFAPDSGAYGGGHRHGHEISYADDYRVAQAVYNLHEPVAT